MQLNEIVDGNVYLIMRNEHFPYVETNTLMQHLDFNIALLSKFKLTDDETCTACEKAVALAIFRCIIARIKTRETWDIVSIKQPPSLNNIFHPHLEGTYTLP